VQFPDSPAPYVIAAVKANSQANTYFVYFQYFSDSDCVTAYAENLYALSFYILIWTSWPYFVFVGLE
jgi:hypothetical protein